MVCWPFNQEEIKLIHKVDQKTVTVRKPKKKTKNKMERKTEHW